LKVLRENYFTEGRSGGATYFVFDSRETVPPKLRRLIQSLDDGPSWVGADGFLGFGVEERDKEERDIVFPGDATEGRQVDFGYYVTVPIGSIRDEEFPRVGGVVDIPATSPRWASVGLDLLAFVKILRSIQELHTQRRPEHRRTRVRCGRVQLV